MKYTKEELEKMSNNKLEFLDIFDPRTEQIVQEIINSRRKESVEKIKEYAKQGTMYLAEKLMNLEQAIIFQNEENEKTEKLNKIREKIDFIFNFLIILFSLILFIFGLQFTFRML